MASGPKRTYYIYCHTAPNGKRYIGQTSKSPEKRWQNGRNYRTCTYFNHAIEKYGWENIRHDILAICHTKQMASLIEKHLIAFFDTQNPERGYNLTSGGEGAPGVIVSDETRALLSKIRKEKGIPVEQQQAMLDGLKKSGYTAIPSTKEDMLTAGRKLAGDKHPCYGKRGSKKPKAKRKYKHSAEWRENIHKGLVNSEKVQAKKRSVLQIGDGDVVVARYESITDAADAMGVTKTAISLVCRGVANTACGFFWVYEDEELRKAAEELMKQKHSIETIGLPVEQYDMSGELVAVYASTVEASRQTGFARAGITDCCRGRRKKSHGYVWRYRTEPLDTQAASQPDSL